MREVQAFQNVRFKLDSSALLINFYNEFCILEIPRHCIVEVDE